MKRRRSRQDNEKKKRGKKAEKDRHKYRERFPIWTKACVVFTFVPVSVG